MQVAEHNDDGHIVLMITEAQSGTTVKIHWTQEEAKQIGEHLAGIEPSKIEIVRADQLPKTPLRGV